MFDCLTMSHIFQIVTCQETQHKNQTRSFGELRQDSTVSANVAARFPDEKTNSSSSQSSMLGSK